MDESHRDNLAKTSRTAKLKELSSTKKVLEPKGIGRPFPPRVPILKNCN